MAPRTNGALELHLTGNVQGCIYLYSLATGCIICCRCWTSLLMPFEVINREHEPFKDKAKKE